MEENMNNTVLEFECIGMDNGSKFPIEYTGRGQDVSPEFVIKNLSPNAKTLAVTLEELSHPIKDFTHWVIWNIPATDRIKKNIPAGKSVPMLGNAYQGVGYGLHRYAGPKPPKGKKHTYRFTVYSLDCEINISANSMKRNFLKKAEKHIIQKGSIIGEFE
jgi:Raf kinase inhibitor-like YbhB/YbcL family protein